MKRVLTFLAACLCLAPSAVLAQGAILAEWVEDNPFNAFDQIALGYPVPIPVDTPAPFDGFRTYAGLHTRHQDLAITTPWVHPHQIGITRAGRTIWAYRVGDDDFTTPWGLPEPATLTNGGIHAREWSTPESVTGILELLATAPEDDHFHDYLRDHVNMVVIPVLNIDGFLQTQRYATLNYLGTDPDFPDSSPRDGRMRRKNLLQADEDLGTFGDHLNGVDLNRNNAPYWATDNERSSGNPASLVHHGQDPGSEPETRALYAAPLLGPEDRLRMYTDVHSFSQVHFWSRIGGGTRLARQTQEVLRTFTNHHREFDAAKRYHYATMNQVPINQGIGATDEYFMHTYRIPSWTLETEPSGGQDYHLPLPGAGADYGGAAVNGHDGFILPESEARRVREELAQSFAVAYYRQSGPPHVQALRIVDEATGSVVHEAQWDPGDDFARVLFTRQSQTLALGRPYRLWVGFSKPMRWLDDDGDATALPGHGSAAFLDVTIDAMVGDTAADFTWGDPTWAVAPGGAPAGFMRYRTDAYVIPFVIEASPANQALFAETAELGLQIRANDMTYMGLDGDPATVTDWGDGHWVDYEDTQGLETDTGGADSTHRVLVSAGEAETPFTLAPGIASAWADPAHGGEGFIIEMLDGDRAVLYWFTYGNDGEQDWFIAVGEQRGNRLLFPELLRTDGGEFGPGGAPGEVTQSAVGSAKFTFTGCDTGDMDWHIGNRRGRQAVQRITRIMGLPCGPPTPGVPPGPEAAFSGAWGDPAQADEGFTLEVLDDGRGVVYWFSFDPDGAPRWFFGVGEHLDGDFVFEQMLTTRGGRFGVEIGQGEISELPWGRLTLDLDCEGGTATFSSTEAGFGDGTVELARITTMEGLACPL